MVTTRKRTKVITDDTIEDAVIPVASRLIWAVREEDPTEVAAALAAANAAVPSRGVTALAIVLAAMVPDDRPISDLLAWRRDPHEYRRLRAAGVDAYVAMALINDDTYQPARGAS